MKEHLYTLAVEWTGNNGQGTTAYESYEREHVIRVPGKEPLKGSSDPSFRGDIQLYNPEELFIASLSACHMLWYLHLCATDGVVVTEYEDRAEGVLTLHTDGSGRITSVQLNPLISVTEGHMIEKAIRLHKNASEMCFLASSCNFEVKHKPTVKIAGGEKRSQ
ncbi:OsmC family protein [Robertkochia aurantiaca]|uniref:OsmC family protein n=1 Tax=Robertkochia aurantiaca TaxID=2873700 RepID=UPI001CCB1DFA|nr:OsmC family protein [Robertkochia sp. 3YJGBD-33]